MINKKQINQFAKRIISTQQGLTNQQLMHPRREWVIGVLVAICIFVASIAWSSFKYFEYQDIDQQLVSQPAAPLVVYRAALVEEALKAFAGKTKRLDKILQENSSATTEPVTDDQITVDGESTATSTSTSTAATATSTTDTVVEPVSNSSSTEDISESVAEPQETAATPRR